MVKITEPETLTRMGVFNRDLGEAVKKFSERLVYLPAGLGNTNKYILFKEENDPYLLIASQQKDKILSPSGYNTILTITSYSDKFNQEVAGKFEKETEIKLNAQVPDSWKAFYQYMNLAFQAFEKNPKAAMIFLKGF